MPCLVVPRSAIIVLAVARPIVPFADRAVVVVLGGAHDLTDNLKRAKAKVEYLRIEVEAYRKLGDQGAKKPAAKAATP